MFGIFPDHIDSFGLLIVYILANVFFYGTAGLICLLVLMVLGEFFSQFLPVSPEEEIEKSKMPYPRYLARREKANPGMEDELKLSEKEIMLGLDAQSFTYGGFKYRGMSSKLIGRYTHDVGNSIRADIRKDYLFVDERTMMPYVVSTYMCGDTSPFKKPYILHRFGIKNKQQMSDYMGMVLKKKATSYYNLDEFVYIDDINHDHEKMQISHSAAGTFKSA